MKIIHYLLRVVLTPDSTCNHILCLNIFTLMKSHIFYNLLQHSHIIHHSSFFLFSFAFLFFISLSFSLSLSLPHCDVMVYLTYVKWNYARPVCIVMKNYTASRAQQTTQRDAVRRARTNFLRENCPSLLVDSRSSWRADVHSQNKDPCRPCIDHNFLQAVQVRVFRFFSYKCFLLLI